MLFLEVYCQIPHDICSQNVLDKMFQSGQTTCLLKKSCDVWTCCFRWDSSTMQPKHLMHWRSWIQDPTTGRAKGGHVLASSSSYWQTRNPSIFVSLFCTILCLDFIFMLKNVFLQSLSLQGYKTVLCSSGRDV